MSDTENQVKQNRPRWYVPLMALAVAWGVASFALGPLVATDNFLLGVGVMAVGAICGIVGGVGYLLQPIMWTKEGC